MLTNQQTGQKQLDQKNERKPSDEKPVHNHFFFSSLSLDQT